jgi:predicted transposase/invertase (TIGR01784 family)
MRCSGHKIVLLLYILESASGFSHMPHMQKKRIVLRCPGPFTDAPEGDNQERKDWMTFLFRAHEMTEEDVAAQIKTPAVLEAFKLAKLSTLPDDVRAAYEAEVREHDRYAQHKAELIRTAKIEVARKLLAMNLTVDQIEKATGLSSEDIKSIK